MNPTFAHNTISPASSVIWGGDKGGTWESSTHRREGHTTITHTVISLIPLSLLALFTKENSSCVAVRGLDLKSLLFSLQLVCKEEKFHVCSSWTVRQTRVNLCSERCRLSSDRGDCLQMTFQDFHSQYPAKGTVTTPKSPLYNSKDRFWIPVF